MLTSIPGGGWGVAALSAWNTVVKCNSFLPLLLQISLISTYLGQCFLPLHLSVRLFHKFVIQLSVFCHILHSILGSLMIKKMHAFRFTLCATKFYGFWQCIVSCIHHYSVIYPKLFLIVNVWSILIKKSSGFWRLDLI